MTVKQDWGRQETLELTLGMSFSRFVGCGEFVSVQFSRLITWVEGRGVEPQGAEKCHWMVLYRD